MMTITTHVFALVLGACAGYYAHYKWGAKLAADLAKVKSVV